MLAGYPELFLARCKLPKPVLQGVIRSQLAGPKSELVTAQQMYVGLMFVPELLHGDAATMRAVVEQLFHTSWVVSWAPGQVIDVALEWQRYRFVTAAYD